MLIADFGLPIGFNFESVKELGFCRAQSWSSTPVM